MDLDFSAFLLSTSEARRQLSTLNEFTPLPLFHKALLHTYKGPKSSKKVAKIEATHFSHTYKGLKK